MYILSSLLHNFSQLFFQANSTLGAIIAISYGVFSPAGLLLALVGGGITNLTASFLGIPQGIVKDGVVGFNGVLIGTAMAYYIKGFYMELFFTVLLSILCTLIFLLFYKLHVPPLALPFVLCIWVFLLLSKYLK